MHMTQTKNIKHLCIKMACIHLVRHRERVYKRRLRTFWYNTSALHPFIAATAFILHKSQLLFIPLCPTHLHSVDDIGQPHVVTCSVIT